MWCDNFDMDLPKVIPGALEALGDLANVELVTTGSITDGKLNHPCCWNGDTSILTFFGFKNSARPSGYVAGGMSKEVRCTFWEAIRDAWPHHYLIQVERAFIWDTMALTTDFEAIMFHIRGWRTMRQAGLANAQRRVLDSLKDGVDRFRHQTQLYAPAVRRREDAHGG